MKVKLNDNEVQIEPSQSLLELLEINQLQDKNGIAVALNNTVVPKAQWTNTQLKDDDKIIVITATAGG